MADDSLKQKTKVGLLWTALNNFVNYGLQFVVGIIMARLLSPTDYGITAIPTVFISIASVFIDSGFAAALIRKSEVTERDMTTTFVYSFLVGLSCYLLMFVCAPILADFYDTPILTSLIRVTALTFIWSPLATPQNILLQRELDFQTIARISVIAKIAGSLVGVVLALTGFGLWSLIIMNIVSSLFQLIQMWIKVRWVPRAKWSKESFRYLWGFGNKLMLTTLIDKAYGQIIPVFVGKYYSTADLGVYNRAQGYAQLPSVQVTNVIQQVTYPVLSKLQEDKDALERIYRRMIRTTAFIVFPIMMMLSALARPLIIVLVTDKWEGAILLLQLMCFSMMWYPIHAMNLNLLQVAGRSDLFLKLEFVKKGYGLIAMAITLPISLVAVVLSRWVTNIVSLFVNTYYTGKLLGITFLIQMRDLLPTMIVSTMMWAIVYGITFIVSSYYLQIIIGSIVGALFYVGVAYIKKRPELDELMFFLKRKK